MEINNVSAGGYFILVSFSDQPWLEEVLLLIISVFYILSLVGNGTIIVVSQLDPQLHTPMYFFLTHLSIIDLCHMTTIVPQMFNLQGPDKSISYVGCVMQFFMSLGLGDTECVLLAFTAYDRYAATCQPLHYMNIMPPHIYYSLAGASWTIGFGNSVAHTAYGMSLPRCGHNMIHHFYCESAPTIQLACEDITTYKKVIFVVSIILIVLPLLFIVVSYGCITWTVMGIKSSEGRKKAFGTCGSHLTVVSFFYTTLIYIYMKPKQTFSQDVDKFVALFYNLVPPIINPLIYTLRNKDAKGAIRRLFLGKKGRK